ncbi:glycosyltransferase involved in cell wall biosynthesis [Hasllibacter halocynthiae]|uniref:Glycosyltransferase involved in cell wall biosynthesis n=1 Tax=Hasllibacter halocynthiae TaxID=595589 RepID=A0A2T0X220_9RHOB|nr:glycosyltransferase family 4 protein [Hasllibacter halocynthiae]PRY92999.1 glycosyltransferase involved in cell wall biosynthesis [Hasllibacter halocynthiae]
MRIAQVAPLAESVPPSLYGGTERVVSWLTEELVRLGHDVTLFASGDSRTAARLHASVPKALRLQPHIVDHSVYNGILLGDVADRAEEFDVIHSHLDVVGMPLLRSLAAPTLHTLHGRLDLDDLKPFYERFPDEPLVSISDHQRLHLPVDVNWAGTVLHGLPEDELPFRAEPDGYLAFLGRISPEKRPDRAIEIAARSGIPLKIAAKVDRVDREYWETMIEPLIRHHRGLVEYVGEVGGRDKADFLGGASALLFPIDWPEPFGLVMIEAMACGTPVLAWRNGSAPEVLEDDVTGVLVEEMSGALAAVERVLRIDRQGVRAAFEKRFSARRMAEEYVRLYERLVGMRDRAPDDVAGATRLGVGEAPGTVHLAE